MQEKWVADLIPVLGSSTGEGNGNTLHGWEFSMPGKFQEQRSLTGYRPWGCKESDMIEWEDTHAHTHTHTHTHTHPVCLLCTTDSESKRVLMRVEGTSCDENTDFCCPKHLLQLLTRRFFVFILLTSSFFSITIVMLITLKNRRLKDLFFILFTASAYVFHEISPFWQDPIAKTPDWKRQVPVQ